MKKNKRLIVSRLPIHDQLWNFKEGHFFQKLFNKPTYVKVVLSTSHVLQGHHYSEVKKLSKGVSRHWSHEKFLTEKGENSGSQKNVQNTLTNVIYIKSQKYYGIFFFITVRKHSLILVNLCQFLGDKSDKNIC